jgi:hypothetical protein
MFRRLQGRLAYLAVGLGVLALLPLSGALSAKAQAQPFRNGFIPYVPQGQMRPNLQNVQGVAGVGGLNNGSTIVGNNGAGAYLSELFNCVIRGNNGPGAVQTSLANCTVADNFGTSPVVSYSRIRNSIIYYNSSDKISEVDMNHSCTPSPIFGAGNISTRSDHRLRRSRANRVAGANLRR